MNLLFVGLALLQPPVQPSDVEYFQLGSDECQAVLSFNRSYKICLQYWQQWQRTREGYHQLEWEETFLYLEHHYSCWWTLHSCYHWPGYRCDFLQDLRALLGYDAYYSGCMPPLIPEEYLP